MLNLTPIRGNNQYAAAHYFSAADDYYANEHPGQWQGKGAQALGLAGAVAQAQLSRLMNGQLPNGARIQTTFDPATKSKRMGLDLTFSAPKSVSMQALVAGDSAVSAAHDRAVQLAIEQVERLAAARQKVAGHSRRERTANLVVGKFRHEMSRAKDPQLHTHALVLNMTQRADGAWRALANEDIFHAYDGIDALYKAELARGVQALGYAIRLVDDRGNFELAHISRAQIAAFSGRSSVIEEALADAGKTRASATTLEKQVIALATRPRKDERERAIVKQYWVEKSRTLAIAYHARSRLDGRNYPSENEGFIRLPASLTPAQAVVQYAIDHLTEREAVVSESQLTATALKRAVGLAGVQEVQAEIKRLATQGTLIASAPAYRLAGNASSPLLSAHGWQAYWRQVNGCSVTVARRSVDAAIGQGALVAAEQRYTTQKALKREQAVLAIERSGRGQVAPLLSAAAVHQALAQSLLNTGQRAAVMTILTTSHRFVGIQGDAGTGKTSAVRQAVALIGKAGGTGGATRTRVLAPYGSQVKALQDAGLDAQTLASFLRSKNKAIDAKTVVVLDEAGVIGARQLEQAMRTVERAGARMVLLGDTKQTEAIEAGRPFAQLQQAGMQTARIHEILRQTDPYLKTAVAAAASGRANSSLAHIRHVAEWPHANDRHRAIVRDYLALSAAERRASVIVVGTNDARREINSLVRAALALAGNGRPVAILTRVDMTQAQRRFALSYQPGMVIQPEKDYPKAGLLRGETYRVRETAPGNGLVLERPDGSTTTVNPRRATQLSVYHLERAELSVGDTIRINRNDAARDLTNGERLRVAAVGDSSVRLESSEPHSGRVLRTLEMPLTRPLHLEHAYASTVHSAQGLTHDRALIAIDTASRTTSFNLYYVAISRARVEARIYTNSIQALPEAIARRAEKSTALALQRERHGGGIQRERQEPADGKQPPTFGRFG
jgi:conjugative relaxase-like TrwC/TraI family protein